MPHPTLTPLATVQPRHGPAMASLHPLALAVFSRHDCAVLAMYMDPADRGRCYAVLQRQHDYHPYVVTRVDPEDGSLHGGQYVAELWNAMQLFAQRIAPAVMSLAPEPEPAPQPAAAEETLEQHGYRLRTREGFLSGAVDFCSGAPPEDVEQIRNVLRDRVELQTGTHVVYDPNDGDEGWLVVGSEAEVRAATMQMIREQRQ